MKKYDKDKQREQWTKYEAMGKGKYLAFMTTIFTGSVLIPLIILYLIIRSIFGDLIDFSNSALLLKLSIYIIAMVFFSVRMGSKTWDKKMRELHGYEVAELEDAELKKHILDGEKIKAVKRYRDITGAKLKDAIEYIDLLSEKYL
ncbi:hypothetical protein [Clostridium folliculivorans]|uniref:50S ribosomal protein L7/L12 n=1 Tax=Clostridium folliculivorans TaxID=2886038 RepID=A0A9W5Y271_9CLOT|nr:hypothetical protein [Clostridium folliculivorans]GKU25162.1 hypothetical protein CFOLD11_19880 [Clostridium folliculivorans]GKU31260.1 hypothetical protein CFB3_33670 [Clostridium folliculivorans]